MEKNICIVVPIKSTLIDINSPYISEINDEKPEFVEFRFDFIKKIEDLTIEFMKELKNMINPEIFTIFTFRHYSEGGNIHVSRDEQLIILKTLINAHPNYIDIELNSDPKLLNQVVRYAINSNVKVILSYHDFQKTPNYDEAIELIKEFEDKLISINLDTITEFVFKFVFTAQKFQDNLIPLKICRNFKKKNRKIISFCMGEEGTFSRIICLFTGSFLTYSFISQKIVSGQINIKLLRELYQIINFSNLFI